MAESCTRCGGTGKIYVDDLHERECLCAHVRALSLHLGTAIVRATNIEASPLFIPGIKPGEPDQDRTKDNLFLKGCFENLMSHIKYALVWKGRMFSFRHVTDEALLAVWFGKESYASRPKSLREDLETFNSLADMVGDDSNKLVIIQLGALRHKNAAMPGVLNEALMIRRLSSGATWILEETPLPFGPGHLAYSDEAANLIAAHYDVLELGGPHKPEDDPRPPAYAGVEDIDLSEPSQDVLPKYTKSRFEPGPPKDDLLNDSVLSSNRPKHNGSKKPRGGGGPI